MDKEVKTECEISQDSAAEKCDAALTPSGKDPHKEIQIKQEPSTLILNHPLVPSELLLKCESEEFIRRDVKLNSNPVVVLFPLKSENGQNSDKFPLVSGSTYCASSFGQTDFFRCKKENPDTEAANQSLSCDGQSYYMCDLCGEVLFDKSDYAKHCALKHGKAGKRSIKPNSYFIKSYSPCDICGVILNNGYSLDRHKKRKHGISLPSTSRDSKTNVDVGMHTSVKQESSTRMQMREDTGNISDLISEDVSVDADRNIASESMANSVTGSTSLYECGVCSAQFSDFQILGVHLQKHSVGNFKCNQCEMTFLRKESLIKHSLLFVEDKRKCTVCEMPFMNRCELEQHMTAHRKEPGFPNTTRGILSNDNVIERLQSLWKCDVCNMGFRYLSELMIHKDNHALKPLQTCAICGLGFYTCSNLEYHMSMHSVSKSFKCNVCGMEFYINSMLVYHKRSHINKKAHVCYICNRHFSQTSNLKLHIRTHTGEKPYKCSVCGKEFASSSSMATHQRRHTGEKSHECSECGKAFVEHSVMMRHKRSVHLQERNVKCDICDSGFFDVDKLKRHKLNVHNLGGNKSKCKLCSKSFPSKSKLERHVARVHSQ